MTQATPPPADWEEQHRRHRDGGLRKRFFTVAGSHKVFGARKGETVAIDITDDAADALIESGHVVEKSSAVDLFVVSDSAAVELSKTNRTAPVTGPKTKES